MKISQHDLVVGSVSNKELSLSSLSFSPCRMFVIKSMGRGNMTVEFFSADIEFKVWKSENYIRTKYTQPQRHTPFPRSIYHWTEQPCQ